MIVPVYNEAENFPALLAEIEHHVPPPFVLHVVYDFDEDTTVPVARAMAAEPALAPAAEEPLRPRRRRRDPDGLSGGWPRPGPGDHGRPFRRPARRSPDPGPVPPGLSHRLPEPLRAGRQPVGRAEAQAPAEPDRRGCRSGCSPDFRPTTRPTISVSTTRPWSTSWGSRAPAGSSWPSS